jgi:hypothetical protein
MGLSTHSLCSSQAVTGQQPLIGATSKHSYSSFLGRERRGWDEAVNRTINEEAVTVHTVAESEIIS